MAKHQDYTMDLFYGTPFRRILPFRLQLLKWIGNKQRFAHEIASFFPPDIKVYHEPFLGSGAVLATLQPQKAFGTDSLAPLINIWKTLHRNPELLIEWYETRFREYHRHPKPDGYEIIKSRYNQSPNGADLLFLCRSCYGGVIRFRKADGFISTPCGVHSPITPASFAKRARIWQKRTSRTTFDNLDYREAMERSKEGDMIYCDPPYTHSQGILYRGQEFRLQHLLVEIGKCKDRGVKVALSIDGKKKSGKLNCELDIPDGLFEREVFVNCGRSMLRRFQRSGDTLTDEVVHDRLLLTY